VQRDNRIVVGGMAGINSVFTLDRLLPDGSWDGRFGQHGHVTTRFPVEVRLEDVTVQPDGKLVAGGEVVAGAADAFVFARYQANGRLDPSFGRGGLRMIRLVPDEHHLAEMTVQPDGKIVATGYLSQNPTLLGMVRLQEDRSLDATFGDGGVVIMTEIENFTTVSVALQPDGRILSSGRWVNEATSSVEFGLVRHLSDGTLDANFGEGGLAHLDIGRLGYFFAEDSGCPTEWPHRSGRVLPGRG
jgi:uncharacterized delta-60 repeat protein